MNMKKEEFIEILEKELSRSNNLYNLGAVHGMASTAYAFGIIDQYESARYRDICNEKRIEIIEQEKK